MADIQLSPTFSEAGRKGWSTEGDMTHLPGHESAPGNQLEINTSITNPLLDQYDVNGVLESTISADTQEGRIFIEKGITDKFNIYSGSEFTAAESTLEQQTGFIGGKFTTALPQNSELEIAGETHSNGEIRAGATVSHAFNGDKSSLYMLAEVTGADLNSFQTGGFREDAAINIGIGFEHKLSETLSVIGKGGVETSPALQEPATQAMVGMKMDF